jgi:hypothetical protein
MGLDGVSSLDGSCLHKSLTAVPKPTRADRHKRVDPLRDAAHLRRIQSLPCYLCRAAPPSESHHPCGLQWGTGTGLKASDYDTIPLCRLHHDECHRVEVETWEAKYGTHLKLLTDLRCRA